MRILVSALSAAVLVVGGAQTAAVPTAAAQTAAVDPPDVPAVLDVHRYDPAATLVLDAQVQLGVQVYECAAAPGAAPAWVLRGPQALLGTPSRAEVYHSFGPRWELLADGSAVTGTVFQKAPSATPGAVAQLLLTAQPDPSAPGGQLTGVAWVQRLDTRGGTPTGTCDSAHVGRTTAAPYSAHYSFWAA